MTSVAATIPTVASTVTLTVGRPFKSGIQPTALKTDADNCPPSQQGNKAQRNQYHSPVHRTSHSFPAKGVAREYGPVVTPRTRGLA